MVTSRIASIALAIVLAASCGAATKPQPAYTATPTCAATRTADGMYQLWQAKNDATWSSGDQMTSYKASSGLVYWLSGDYISGREDQATGGHAAGWSLRHNTVMMQSGCTITRANSGSGDAIPDVDGWRHWPQAVVEHSGTLVVLAQKVRGGGEGFELGGTSIATFPILAGGKLGPAVVTPGPEGAVKWAGATVVRSGYVYVYGYATVADPFAPQRSYVARVPVGSVSSVSSWTYWTGSAWTASVGSAVSVRDCQVSSAAVIGLSIVAVCKNWHGIGTEADAHTGPDPWGPFTRSVMFTSPRGTFQGVDYQTYQPMIHTAFPQNSGKVLVSISRNHTDHTQLGGRADLYKQLFFEVTL